MLIVIIFSILALVIGLGIWLIFKEKYKIIDKTKTPYNYYKRKTHYNYQGKHDNKRRRGPQQDYD